MVLGAHTLADRLRPGYCHFDPLQYPDDGNRGSLRSPVTEGETEARRGGKRLLWLASLAPPHPAPNTGVEHRNKDC